MFLFFFSFQPHSQGMFLFVKKDFQAFVKSLFPNTNKIYKLAEKNKLIESLFREQKKNKIDKIR